MPIIALYNLNDAGTTAADSAPLAGLQDGAYVSGAASSGGRAQLDGVDDRVKFFSEGFQLPRGTLEIQFSQTAHVGDGPNTILSRDSLGETAGGFRAEVLADGSIRVSHESPTGTTTFQTDPGFLQSGEEIRLTYSFDETGPGRLDIANLTDGGSYSAPVPAGLTMDMGGNNQYFMIGAGQSSSNPWLLDNLDAPLNGSVEYFQISNSVDNTGGTPTPQPDTAVTDEDTPLDIPVLANDTDPQGQTLTLVGGGSPNGTVTVNPDGTLRYVPNPNFNGTDTITYTVTDPDGNTATSTCTITVRPVNDAPVANPDSASTPAGTPVTIPVLANDTDVDGDTLTILGTPTTEQGTVTVNPNGTLTFTPATGFSGPATVTYDVTDGNGGTATSTVSILVGPPPARDGFVDGTPGGDLIDTAYLGDPDGDRIDAGDAILTGDLPDDDRVRAGDGDDTIRSGEGADEVFGGNGNDDIDTGAPGAAQLPDRGYPGLYPADADPLDDRDTVFGGAGDDTIRTGDDNDLIYAGSGADSVDGGFDDDSLYGGSGDDTLVGGEGSDEIYGQGGNDLIYGGLGPGAPDAVNIVDPTDLRPDNGRDTIYGGQGDDTIFGLDDDDEIYGGAGNDSIDAGIDDDTVYGGAGNDTITGGQGLDSLYGGNDRDTFTGLQAGDQVFGGGGGDDFDTLDLRGSGPFRIVDRVEDAEGNGFNGTVQFLDADRNVTGTATFDNIEDIIPCFTPGTLIATPRGEVPVESLRPGDRVITRDNGLREVVWTGARPMDRTALALNPHLQPVMIRQGSLGNGLPERDMLVSPNHRMLVANDRTALYFDEHEVLVAAKHLVGARGVMEVQSAGTTYIHFMCDRHEVVLANGAWTETFQPGDYTLKGMGNAQRAEIFELFPDLRNAQGI
ncbi:MAG TPA: Hint domain-containing protein, partial [Paracoccaceae bacterium]|nr:Hint domain-containing protein [Paracoccaceae bacterium]